MLTVIPSVQHCHCMYFTDKEIEAEVAVVRTLGREPGAVSPSVGKRKQKERDVRRRPGGFLSEAGVRGGGPGRKRPGGRGSLLWLRQIWGEPASAPLSWERRFALALCTSVFSSKNS